MIIVVLVVLGLCLGSFVNALVWRVHEQDRESSKKHPNSLYLNKLSIRKGRSLCPHCKHELKAQDLMPFFSWLSLGGKCRYCKKTISLQYPLVELITALLFVGSYLWWPQTVEGIQIAIFTLWLLILTGLTALTVYDLRWYLLPNRIMLPLSYLAGFYAALQIYAADNPSAAFIKTSLAVLIGGGIFYLLFQLSNGKWIGGGDVKLGWLLGLLVATPANSLLFIFLAALAGSLVSLPLLVKGRLKRSSTIPFGPFLIGGAVVVVLFGSNIIHWYTGLFT